MSKNNNVNPGQYKVAGRERQGEEVVHEVQKRVMQTTGRSQAQGSPNFIPGALPVGVRPKDQEHVKPRTSRPKPGK